MSDIRKLNFYSAFQFPVYVLIILWVIHIFKVSGLLRIGNYGLIPREMDGIIGIFTSPFIHGNYQHLLSNSVPLFLLTFIIILFYRKVAYQSILLIYVLTGLTVWAFARGNVMHIGASGVVYGLVSFVFWTGIFRRNAKSIILALIVTLLYSGYFLGVLPTQEGISWESHLFGGFIGIIVAYWMKDNVESSENKDDPWSEEDKETNYFLPRDTFEETRKQRAMRRQGEGQDYWKSDRTW